MEKLRVFEAFSGYGSQALALERVKKEYPDFDFEVIGISDIEENAIKAYNAIHGETKNYGDISKIDWKEVPDFDFFTYSFPCQDLSIIGKHKGLTEGSGTRSSLLWECARAIEAKQPKYLLMENVKGLTFKTNEEDFKKWREWLEDLGYTNYWKVLNSINYGVPQSRERIFMISIKDEHEPFEFPSPIPLKKRFEDIMDKNVPERCWVYPKDDGFYSRKRIDEMLTEGTIDLKKTQWIDLYTWSAKVGYTGTITTRVYGSGNFLIGDNGVLRKPTERETLRLMGVDDETIDKMLALNLHHTKYHIMAGNSIVVDVMFHLFRKLFIKDYVEEIEPAEGCLF